MDGYAANPDLMKYLQGEISFETWLEQQAHRNNSHEHQTTSRQQSSTAAEDMMQITTSQMTSTTSSVTTDDPGSVFSSWGDAFTSSLGAGIESNQDQYQPSSHFVGHNLSSQSQMTSLAAGSLNMNEEEDSDFEEEEEDDDDDDDDDIESNAEEIHQLGETFFFVIY